MMHTRSFIFDAAALLATLLITLAAAIRLAGEELLTRFGVRSPVAQ
jgi:hypothetical protein